MQIARADRQTDRLGYELRPEKLTVVQGTDAGPDGAAEANVAVMSEAVG